jgi:nicotinamidase-related amidase
LDRAVSAAWADPLRRRDRRCGADAFLATGLDELLRSTGKRFVLVAGLVTSTCVLLTAATATQLGYLVALVEDCCADRQPLHDRVLNTYRFMFGTTRSDRLCQDRPEWEGQLRRLAQSQALDEPRTLPT